VPVRANATLLETHRSPTEVRVCILFASHNKEVEIWPGLVRTRLNAQSVLTYPSLWPGKRTSPACQLQVISKPHPDRLVCFRMM
jgi:hypothetical protein